MRPIGAFFYPSGVAAIMLLGYDLPEETSKIP